jgi:hypothetical protein
VQGISAGEDMALDMKLKDFEEEAVRSGQQSAQAVMEAKEVSTRTKESLRCEPLSVFCPETVCQWFLIQILSSTINVQYVLLIIFFSIFALSIKTEGLNLGLDQIRKEKLRIRLRILTCPEP